MGDLATRPTSLISPTAWMSPHEVTAWRHHCELTSERWTSDLGTMERSVCVPFLSPHSSFSLCVVCMRTCVSKLDGPGLPSSCPVRTYPRSPWDICAIIWSHSITAQVLQARSHEGRSETDRNPERCTDMDGTTNGNQTPRIGWQFLKLLAMATLQP